mgnify:CR=1 FL=1
MRIFIAALGTETNTFSPLPTGRKTFEETLWVRRDASLSSDNYFVLPLREWRRLAEAAGDEVIESLSAFAQPAGRTVQAVWEELRDTLLGDLRAAGPLDLVLQNLHGAMASEQCDDCEGELVEMVRQVVGPEVTVGVEFDLHCHISERLMRSADLLVLYKEYPHTDVAERGAELFELARRTVLGEIRPVMALRDLRMLDVWRTSDAPVRELVDWMQAAEQRDKVLSVSFGHGFPWADVPDVGAKTVVVTDGDPDLAEAVAKELGDRIWALRETYKANLLDVAETMAAIAGGNGCTVVADISDNAGCGAASDSTFLLEPLLATKAEQALFGLLRDPAAVRICEEAGEAAARRQGQRHVGPAGRCRSQGAEAHPRRQGHLWRRQDADGRCRAARCRRRAHRDQHHPHPDLQSGRVHPVRHRHPGLSGRGAEIGTALSRRLRAGGRSDHLCGGRGDLVAGLPDAAAAACRPAAMATGGGSVGVTG